MMVENVFNDSDNEDLKISDDDDVKIIETNRVWKICEDVRMKSIFKVISKLSIQKANSFSYFFVNVDKDQDRDIG